MELTHVYFIYSRTSDAVKIGRSKSPDKRLRELQTGNSNNLSITYIIKDVEPAFELYVHEICRDYRLEGEWFKHEAVDHLKKNPWFLKNMIDYKSFKETKEIPIRQIIKSR